ncbi:Siderophore-interacting FAD-binding domain protein [Cutibacterium avidum]|nr:Siderophore-interacting FAD-binding domain protein [Cutibacterium avidum]
MMADYRPYLMELVSRRMMEPGFMRIVLSGGQTRFPPLCLDRRIKVLFTGDNPSPALIDPDVGDGWYQRWLEDPERPEMRTYTVRAATDEGIVIDVACHDNGGPGHHFATAAALGSRVLVIGPDPMTAGAEQAGIDFHPGDATHLLLLGDETAAPAICSILEQLTTCNAKVEAVVEVPRLADRVDVGPDGSWVDSRGNHIQISWRARCGQRGDQLTDAVEDYLDRFPQPRCQQDRLEENPDDVLWDTPQGPFGGFYAWIAGESSMVRQLRRALVDGHGIDRRHIAFMGYWRKGNARMWG